MPNLTPDIIQELLRQIQTQGPGFNGGAQYGGQYYAPVYGQGSYSGADNYTPGQLQEWQQYDPIQGASGNESVYNGKTAQRYDAQGNYIGDGTFTNVADQTPIKDLAKFAATAAALYGAGNFINNGFSGFGGSGADVAASEAGGSGFDPSMADMSGYNIPPVDPIAPTAEQLAAIQGSAAGMGAQAAGSFAGGLTAAELATLTSAAGAVPSVFNAAKDSQAANESISQAGGDPTYPTTTSMPKISTMPDTSTGTGGLGDIAKLIKDNPWLAPVLGGVLGSQPTTSSQSVAKKMDPRMDAYVYGTGGSDRGLLGNASDWYSANKSGMNATMTDANERRKGLLTDPSIAKNFQSIGATGMGLLSRPMAGNPYTQGQMPQFGSSLMAQEMERRRRARGGV